MPPVIDRVSKVQNPVEQTIMTNNNTGSMAFAWISRHERIPESACPEQQMSAAQATATTKTVTFSD
jgi:hypothetical protein